MKYVALGIVLLLAPLFSSTHGIATKNYWPIPKEYPRVSYADSIISKNPTTIAQRHKNPANLVDFNTGKYKVFPTLKDGYNAMIRQIELYQSGRSIHTDTATTLSEYVKIYDPSSLSGKYLTFMVGKLGVGGDTKIRDIPRDSLVKYHINLEDRKLFKLMYGTKP